MTDKYDKIETVNLYLTSFSKELNDKIVEITKPTKRYFTKTNLVEAAVKQYFDNKIFRKEMLKAIELLTSSNQDNESNHEFMDQIKQQVYEISKIRNELVMDQSMLLENRKLKHMIHIVYLLGLDRADLVREYLLKEIEQRIAFEELKEDGLLLDQDDLITLSDERMQRTFD